MNPGSFFCRVACIAATLLLSICVTLAEQLATASVFGSHMVLQREMPLPVWGVAEPGSKVTVTFSGQHQTATTSEDGKWRIVLTGLPASAQPATMTIASGGHKLSYTDVLVGEVWLCSGQSNMQFKLANSTDAQSEIATADIPKLRLNTVRGWAASSPQTAPTFSAVAWYFGRKLQRETGTPVGLIARSVGGTPIEWWTPEKKLGRVPFAKAVMENPSAYGRALATWRKNRKSGEKPQQPGSAEEEVLAGIYLPGKPGNLFARHLEPLAGYGIRGTIWYQGERNSKAGTAAAKAYRPLMANMITSWREEWRQGDFPFLVVQLPTFARGGAGWALVQESQAAAVGDVSNAACIDIRDQPDDGLHPKNKRPIGERLADLAIKMTG